MPLNIRARLNLEVSKFKSNAKVAAASFRTIASSTKISTDKIDAYIKSSQDKHRAQIKRTEAMEIQSARERAKIISKLEQEKYRNRGGIKPGTTAGMQIPIRDVTNIFSLSTKQQKQFIKDVTIARKNAEKQKLEAVKQRARRERELNRAMAQSDKQTLKAILAAYRQAKRQEIAESVKSFAYRKAYDARYLAGKVARELSALSKIKAANKSTIRQMEKDALAAKINYFNSEEFTTRLAAMRYALYDISRRATAFGVAIGAAFAAAVKSAIDFESSFTSVERTTQLSLTSNIPEVRGQAEELRATLIQLSTEIPVAFGDITEIATLGAQMGIAADDVDNFTETVAKFSAITKIGVEDVALSFGRISQLLDVSADDFENLSSAIAYTGVNSVSTDKEILRMSEAIGAAATNAGFAADQTIGFAAALASLKVRPEEARGVLTRLFREFDLSVSAGGSKLDDLARVIGKTSEEAANIWKQDPSQFVQAFLRGAKATGQLNQVITALGITNSRELNVITRLANNMGVLETALADSSEQFELGTFSSEAYGLVVDDLSSKITMLQNSIAAMGAAFGEELVPILKVVVDGLRDVVDNLTAAPDWMQKVLLGVTALTAGLALLVGGTLGTVAGMFALKLIITDMGAKAGAAALGVGSFRAMIISLIPGTTGATGVVSALGLAAKSAGDRFMAASWGVKAFVAALGVIAIAATVVATIAAFAGAAANAEKEAQALAKANFDAAGGLEAFKKASQDGLDAGAKVYDTVTASVSNLTDEQIAEKKSALEADVARKKLTSSTEDGYKAYREAESKLKAFNDEIERGNGLTEESTIAFTENTKAVLANALQKIQLEGGGELNIFSVIAGIKGTEAEAALSAAGLDAVEILNGSMEAAMSGEMSAFDYMREQFQKVAPEMRENKQWTDFVQNMYNAANATDTNIQSAKDANAAYSILGEVIGDAGQSADDMGEGFLDLNDILKTTVKLLTSGALAQGKVADALDTFAQGAAETAGEMDGLGEAARTNLSNFASFMNSAVEASIEAGTGTKGALESIIGGLNALSNAGIDTGDAFTYAKSFIINSLQTIVPGIETMFGMLNASQDMQGIEDAIRALYATKIAAADTPQDVARLRAELEATLSMIAGFGSQFTVSLGKVSQSAGKTQTALEKLQEAISGLFSWTNRRMSVQDSINSLGDSIRENGNTFSIWSEAGRSNVESLLDSIDNLAELSGGDLQKMANYLGALRQALVDAGAPASALRYIDDALKKTGKTAQVSTREVDRFYAELADSAAAKRSLAEIASAVSEVQSALRSNISAYFSAQRAIDDVTLGWYDMSDAADAARDAIASAQETIDDANQSILEANASIKELQAGGKTLEYQLQIAIKYGDELRAEEIRAQIAQNTAEIAGQRDSIADANRTIADAQADIRDAQGDLGIGSTTRQMIEQTRALEDMALKYADATAWMMAMAEPGADLEKIIDDQVDAFLRNAQEMGYSKDEATDLAGVLKDELIAQMDAVPRDIETEISAETSTALKTINSFVTDANNRLATIKDKTITVTTRYIQQAVPGTMGGGGGGSLVRASTGGLIRGAGTATSDSIAAQLSNGEYVVRAAAVSRYGVDFFNALNNMQTPIGSYPVAASAASSSQTVYLSTEDRNLLRQAIDRPIALYTDNATIAKSANDGNTILAQRGIR